MLVSPVRYLFSCVYGVVEVELHVWMCPTYQNADTWKVSNIVVCAFERAVATRSDPTRLADRVESDRVGRYDHAFMPNTHRRRDETVLSRRQCEHNSQLALDDCPRIRSTVWKLTKQTP